MESKKRGKVRCLINFKRRILYNILKIKYQCVISAYKEINFNQAITLADETLEMTNKIDFKDNRWKYSFIKNQTSLSNKYLERSISKVPID